MVLALRPRLTGRSLRAYRDRWIARRIPAGAEQLLGQRNLFIFPTASGFAFLVLLLVLLLTGINYQNNLVLALAFLLGGLLVVGVLHTWANLAQLRIAGGGAEAVFAGSNACFTLRFTDTHGRARDGLRVSWEGAEPCLVRVRRDTAQSVPLYLATQRRGWLQAPRVHIETRYPLGLLRAWTSLDLAQRCLVYPRPAAQAVSAAVRTAAEDGMATLEADGEDFFGFRDYRAGDPLRYVAWKTLAKGQRLQTFDRRTFSDRSHWLRWSDTEGGGDAEQRLGQLCRLVLDFNARDLEYGLELPGLRLEPARGEVQRTRALSALALFDAGRAGV